MIGNGAPVPLDFQTVPLQTGLERQPRVIQCFRAPCTIGGAERPTVDSSDWLNLGMLGSDLGMQWYVLTHPGSQLPTPAPGGQISVPGVRATFNPNLLIIGLVIIGAIIVLK